LKYYNNASGSTRSNLYQDKRKKIVYALAKLLHLGFRIFRVTSPALGRGKNRRALAFTGGSNYEQNTAQKSLSQQRSPAGLMPKRSLYCQCCGSGSVSGSGLGSRRANMTHKNRKKLIKK
jgi:hypothetical protein